MKGIKTPPLQKRMRGWGEFVLSIIIFVWVLRYCSVCRVTLVKQWNPSLPHEEGGCQCELHTAAASWRPQCQPPWWLKREPAWGPWMRWGQRPDPIAASGCSNEHGVWSDQKHNQCNENSTHGTKKETMKGNNPLNFHGSHLAYSLLWVSALREARATQRLRWELHHFLCDLDVVASNAAGRVKGGFGV